LAGLLLADAMCPWTHDQFGAPARFRGGFRLVTHKGIERTLGKDIVPAADKDRRGADPRKVGGEIVPAPEFIVVGMAGPEGKRLGAMARASHPVFDQCLLKYAARIEALMIEADRCDCYMLAGEPGGPGSR